MHKSTQIPSVAAQPACVVVFERGPLAGTLHLTAAPRGLTENLLLVLAGAYRQNETRASSSFAFGRYALASFTADKLVYRWNDSNEGGAAVVKS